MARRLKEVVARERIRAAVSRRLTRNERKAQTRAQLIGAAARVFARKGYHAATVDDIAEEAGFTKGAFYSNFESKEDVFVELVADRSRNWTIAVARAYEGEGSFAERLEQGGKVLTRMMNEEGDWMRLFMEMFSQCIRDPRLRKRLAGAYEESRLLIARAVQKEYGPDLPIPRDQLATMILAVTDGFVMQRLADPTRLPAHVLADGLNALFAGIRAVSGKPAD